MKTVWVITGESESGDRSIPKVFSYEPSDGDKENFITDMGEDVHVDGPGDYASCVYLTVTKTVVWDEEDPSQ